jgi:hypothetical protein
MSAGGRSIILHADDVVRVDKEVRLLNPLAIGVTLGSLLLDLVVPRPKPRAGYAYESLRSAPAVPRTPWHAPSLEDDGGAPIARGSSVAALIASRQGELSGSEFRP